jgi:hypothetical protein
LDKNALRAKEEETCPTSQETVKLLINNKINITIKHIISMRLYFIIDFKSLLIDFLFFLLVREWQRLNAFPFKQDN